jgi:hypothetical protein
VGDYVRLNENYIKDWKSEKLSRIHDLKDTIFLVVESHRCYCWDLGLGGGGMLLTLKPFFGPLVNENLYLGRADNSVEILDPSDVDDMMSRYLTEIQRQDER